MLKLLKYYIFYSPAIVLAANLTGSSIFTYCAFLTFLVAAGFFAIRKCHKCGKLFIDFHFFSGRSPLLIIEPRSCSKCMTNKIPHE
jgi:hypothetical protein